MPTQNKQDTRRQIVEKGIKQLLDEAKVPARLHLKVVEALQQHIESGKKDRAAWIAFFQKHAEQMQRYEVESKKHTEQLSTYDEHLKRLESVDWTGIQGEKGDQGESGQDADEEAILNRLIEHIPDPIEGKPGKDGKDGKVETQTIVKHVVDYIKKERPLDITHVKGAQDFVMQTSQKNVRIKFEELMHGTGNQSNGGSGYQQPTSGVVNGTNVTFVWATAPNVIVVDGVPKQKKNSDGTNNWTGTTTTVLSVAPNYDIYATA